MKNKKWIVALIILFPSLFWIILESSTINSKRLPFFGPKTLNEKNDTVYHTVNDSFFSAGDNGDCGAAVKLLDKDTYPLYAIAFLGKRYRPDAYRMTGLWEYLNYSKSKIEHIPFVLVTEQENGNCDTYTELKKLDKWDNITFTSWKSNSFDSLVNTYFEAKPYYIDYSFFVLVDGNRHIRGYYDGRYVAEVKRLIGEYQHLRLKEEKQKLIDKNEIRQK